MEKKKETALLIIEQKGSCTGIRCENCPLYIKKCGIFYCAIFIKNSATSDDLYKKVKDFCITYLNTEKNQLEFKF